MSDTDEKVPHRPPEYGEAMTRRQLHLPDHLYEYAKEIGDGTFAVGVRKCLEERLDKDDSLNTR